MQLKDQEPNKEAVKKNTAHDSGIFENIENHAAWHGGISGIQAERLLRGLNMPFLYLLRSGENKITNQTDYYVTYIQADNRINHIPFQITVQQDGWYWESYNRGGPLQSCVPIDDVLHIIMKCGRNETTPLMKE